jgi:putative acetyltransferase
VIRRARPEDAEAVVRIFRESRAEAMPWLPVLHTPEEDIGHFARQFEAEVAYVFEVDERVVGFAVVKGDELDALYVAPEAQRRGVGSALFTKTQEERPDGFEFWVFRDNERARSFYEAHGARVIGATDGSENEERTPDVRYEWLPTPGRAEA